MRLTLRLTVSMVSLVAAVARSATDTNVLCAVACDAPLALRTSRWTLRLTVSMVLVNPTTSRTSYVN